MTRREEAEEHGSKDRGARVLETWLMRLQTECGNSPDIAYSRSLGSIDA